MMTDSFGVTHPFFGNEEWKRLNKDKKKTELKVLRRAESFSQDRAPGTRHPKLSSSFISQLINSFSLLHSSGVTSVTPSPVFPAALSFSPSSVSVCLTVCLLHKVDLVKFHSAHLLPDLTSTFFNNPATTICYCFRSSFPLIGCFFSCLQAGYLYFWESIIWKHCVSVVSSPEAPHVNSGPLIFTYLMDMKQNF